MQTVKNQSRRFRFTHSILEALPPHDPNSRSREMEFCDMEVIGLHLMVSKTGRKFFYLRYTMNGRKGTVRIGEFPSVKLKDARIRAHELKGMIACGKDPAQERDRRKDMPTLEEFAINDYLPHAKQHKRSWRDDEVRLHKEIIPQFGKYRLDTITTREIQQFHSNLSKSHTPSTANRYLMLVQRMYSLAMQWSVVERNPACLVKKFKENNARERYLSTEEVTRFLKALDTLDNQVIASGLKFLLFTGLRKSEAFHLEWIAVNREGGTVHLTKTKSGKPRTVILNILARQIIDEMWKIREEDHSYVFPGKVKGQPVANPQKPFETACEIAGLENFRIHDLRHSFASLAINSGATLYDVQKLLGHASSQMTQRYAHLADESVRRATEQVAAQISGAA